MRRPCLSPSRAFARVSLLLIFVSVTPSIGIAQEEIGDGADSIASVGCDDATIFDESLISDICWDCIFPIRLAGATIGSLDSLDGPPGGEERRRRTDAPAGAGDDIFCLCYDSLGVPEFGLSLAMWEPARLVEIVREPGCSPILGGIDLPGMGTMRRGDMGVPDYTSADTAFFNYHVWAFPILFMLDLLGVDRCMADGFADLDVMYLSELDPTWNNDALAFWTTPEITLTSTLPAQAACLADAAGANTGYPIDELFWCAGSWGLLYPLSGTDLAPHARPETTSLLTARALAAMHRRGLARRTMGSDTMCEAQIDIFMPKSQYEFSQLHPLAEANGRHALGEHLFAWGEWRNIPGDGDNVHLVWRWNDCCTAVIP